HHPENPHRQPIYTPIEIKSYLDISQADKLQLDMYCWLLSRAQGIEPPHAEFWLGQSSTSTQPSLKQGHLYDEYRLMRAIRAIAMIAISDFEPPPYITKHCHTCHWYGACQKKPQASFDIGLLVGLRKETQADFKKAGIDSLEQLVQLQPHELKQFRGINTTANFYHAQARAWVEQKPIWLTPLPDILKQGGWMFDLETYQDIHTGTEIVWSIGWGDEMGNCMVAVVVPEGKPHTLVINSQLTIYLTPNSDGAWRLMAQTTPDNKPIYHWTGYDSAMMKKSAPEDVQRALAHRLVDLHALFKKTVCFPISSLSIKAVAPYLGFRWSGDDYYLQAYLDYRRWLETFESDYLHHAVNYQADDVKALAVIWQYLTQNGE
ncbi:MAG: ribonuclease H-like domain-containing protein, partial [bacterium]|nr:ribonuclease H-like domain-containing protein [bacterium]